MSRVNVSFSISQEVVNLPDTAQRNLITKILPHALGRAVPVVREALVSKITALANGTATGTRERQSARTKAKFRYHMKDRVRVKSVDDKAGVLKIVGVDNKAGQVNFDHGDKAKTTGRVHKLWWIDGVREKYATPKLRKQTQDIPRMVYYEVGEQVANIIESSVRRSVASGELTK
jgi:hypothetical protein